MQWKLNAFNSLAHSYLNNFNSSGQWRLRALSFLFFFYYSISTRTWNMYLKRNRSAFKWFNLWKIWSHLLILLVFAFVFHPFTVIWRCSSHRPLYRFCSLWMRKSPLPICCDWFTEMLTCRRFSINLNKINIQTRWLYQSFKCRLTEKGFRIWRPSRRSQIIGNSWAMTNCHRILQQKRMDSLIHILKLCFSYNETVKWVVDWKMEYSEGNIRSRTLKGLQFFLNWKSVSSHTKHFKSKSDEPNEDMTITAKKTRWQNVGFLTFNQLTSNLLSIKHKIIIVGYSNPKLFSLHILVLIRL